MIVAQITDLHVKRRGRVLPHMPHVIGPLRRALSSIGALRERPDCILATGDLTESGHREEYLRLRELLAPVDIPVFLLPGNHDRREALRAAFPDAEYMHGAGDPISFTIEAPFARVVAIDTSDSPRQAGYLDAARLEWLDARLRERPNAPTVLAMHHPPFPTGVRYFDEQPFVGRAELGEIVRANPQVRRLVCGHVHQLLCRPWNGTVAVSAPSTAPTIVVHPGPTGFALEQGGFLLHRYDWNGGIATELVRTPAEPVEIVA